MSIRKRSESVGFNSLWVRFAVLMLLTSLSIVTFLVVFYNQTEKRLYREFARQATELSKAVQIGLEGSVGGSLGDPMSLEGYMRNLDAKGIEEVSVINSSHRIIASTKPENIGKWITQQRKEMISKASQGEPVTGEGQLFNIIVPIITNDGAAGYIHLILNTEDFSMLLRLSALRRVFAALFVLSVGTLVAVVLARYYTRPIVAMAAAAGSVAAGDLDQSLPVGRRDEIGQLARSFDRMVVRLREDRQLSERLRTAEHLASAGQFARHIAHEIKNPLNFISLSIDHMGDTYRPTDAAVAQNFDSLVRNLKGEVVRISRFAESFLEFGRPFELHIVRCDMEALLGDVLELVAARARAANVAIVCATDCLPHLQADPEFLRTCLLNIVSNAFEAMPEGGALTVRSAIEDAQLILSFEDTGVGVAGDDLDKLFTPLFSTKPGGLGLGLALTRRVIEEHGGKVQFYSEEGQGSTVMLFLPYREEK